MRFRTTIVHVLVAGLPAAGCDNTASDTKSTAKTATVAKADAKDAKPDAKPDTKVETKQDPVPDPKVPIVVEKPEDIPVQLAGVAVPYDPPEPPPPPKGAAAPAPPAAAAPSAAAAPVAAGPTKIALAHNHPPGEPCKPLTRGEVEQALADLKK